MKQSRPEFDDRSTRKPHETQVSNPERVYRRAILASFSFYVACKLNIDSHATSFSKWMQLYYNASNFLKRSLGNAEFPPSTECDRPPAAGDRYRRVAKTSKFHQPYAMVSQTRLQTNLRDETPPTPLSSLSNSRASHPLRRASRAGRDRAG